MQPFADRVFELLVGPCADTSVGVGRDIGRGDNAERRFDRTTAGKGLADVRHGMTRVAVCDRRQVMTLFDLIERLGVRIRSAAESEPGQPDGHRTNQN
jgi:hypothetical protein